jgi:phosphohistidine phosphatase
MNQIYFAQHGLALDKSENPDRPLSTDGIAQTQAVASQLKSSSVFISHIFHSGKLRAQQTADIFAAVLSTPTPTLHHAMSPMDDSEILINSLSTNHALYVGHLPHLDKVVSSLVTKNDTLQILQFKNSGVVCLNNNSEVYSICWYLTPDLLPSSN